MAMISFFRLSAVFLAATAFVFVAQQIPWLSFLHIFENNDPLYAAFIILGLALFVSLGLLTEWKLQPFIQKGLLAFLPVILFFIFGVSFSHNFHFLVYFSIGLYGVVAFLTWAFRVIWNNQQERIQIVETKVQHTPLHSLKKNHGTFSLASVVLVTLFFFSFGLLELTKFAAVDEPLWLEDRVRRFWKNLGEGDWEKTSISDKPGVTIALASGPSLWFVDPKEYLDTRHVFSANNRAADIEDLYLAFRLPLLIVITLFLPFFYFLLVPLIGKVSALYSYAFIALSPFLIGMSKIVNPDSLLWLFAPLSFFAYLAFLKKKAFQYLILAGIFLGLALLTKYVANILFIYFFGFLFLNYIFTRTETTLSFTEYFKKQLTYFGIWIGMGLTTFYFLFPSVWLRPYEIFTSTLFSEAFERVAPLFLGLIALILIERRFLRGKLTTRIMEYLKQNKILLHRFILSLFILAVLFTLTNGIFGMPWIDFMQSLASPKSIYRASDVFSLFLTNFYPLLFGVPPLVIFSTLMAILFAWRKDPSDWPPGRLTLFLVIFILLYYLGSTVNEVALISRYQIMLYPLMGVLAGIGFASFMTWIREKYSFLRTLDTTYRAGFFLVFVCLTMTLILTPFPVSYASFLLPKTYTVDVKDMGSGSYQAAQYLNSLPQAQELSVWTDKRGVCKFFVGHCTDGFDFREIPVAELDYVVISAGRESRTGRKMTLAYRVNDAGLIRFDTYYEKENPVYELLVNDRPAQFVKIFRFDHAASPLTIF